jgi:biotin operon repressor
MERIAMSQEERDKLEWLKRAQDKVISQREAAEKIGVSERWVRKLLKRMKQQGDRVVVHGLRGRASNRKIEATMREHAIEILKQVDFHEPHLTVKCFFSAQRAAVILLTSYTTRLPYAFLRAVTGPDARWGPIT